MTKDTEMKEMLRLLTFWFTEIRVNNYIDFYDINRISEGLSCKFLNLLYDYNLSDLNKEVKNRCAIDLGDREKKIAFQITSRTDGAKVKETLVKFKQYQLDKEYSNGIKFLILSHEPVKLGRTKFLKIYDKFDKSQDIITEKDLTTEIDVLYDTQYPVFQNILDLFRISFNAQVLKVNISDQDILQKISNCLDRPAFITPFWLENNFGNFKKAIDDTIEAINTGVYRLRDGTLIEKTYPKSMIVNRDIREKIDEIVSDLIKLRATYNMLERKGEIKPCSCGSPECDVSIWSQGACDSMDHIRKGILIKFRSVYPDFRVKFIEIGDLMEL